MKKQAASKAMKSASLLVKLVKRKIKYRNWGSHSGGYEDLYHLVYNGA
jgi:hypothetical protein